jgi:hypothetical protein
MKFCSNCGAELKPEAKFCAACGTPVAIVKTTPVDPEPQPQPVYQKQEPTYEQAKEATNAFTDAIKGKTNLVQRVINIITRPKEEWPVIASEQPNIMKLIGGYALILALIPAISLFISSAVIGASHYNSFIDGISQALKQLFSAVIGVYLLSYVIDMLAPSFESEKNFGRSMQLAVYSSTAMWVAGILLLIPGVHWLSVVAGLYSIYLLAVGLPVLKGTPADKVVGYVALTIVAMIAIAVVLALILGLIFGLFFIVGADRVGF